MEDKLNLLIANGVSPRGVIYVGANDGEEFVQCKELGITNLIAFEPLTAPFERLREIHPDVLAIKMALGSKHAFQPMEVTENDKASSFLSRIDVEDWKSHEVFKDWNMGQWPIVGYEKAEIVRFDEYMDGTYNPTDFNLLFMDVQGMELEALKGFGKFLHYFDGICVELSLNPVYKGEASGNEVSNWLADKGFARISDIQKHDDVLFVRTKI